MNLCFSSATGLIRLFLFVVLLLAHATGQTSVPPVPVPCGGYSDQGCEDCPLCWDVHPYPRRTVDKVEVGWLGQTHYQDLAAIGPYLIPIGIKTTDLDRLLIRCETGCKQVTIRGDWTIDWKVEPYDPTKAYPWVGGSLVDASTIRRDELTDRWSVMYLPPEDLAIGEGRAATIKATIRDLCSPNPDGATEIVFQAITVRQAKNVWQLFVHEMLRVEPEITPPDCGGDPDECELAAVVNDDTPPTERFRHHPQEMFMDEVRPLTLAAKDIDLHQAECGIPTQSCSTFGWMPVCDSISYQWSVDNLAGMEGNGRFTDFGLREQTAMFTATAEGAVRIKIIATSGSGDKSTFYMQILILPRMVQEVDFADEDQHDVVQDGTTTAYRNAGTPKGVEWLDMDTDGDAGDLGEHNFPMAYTMGQKPKGKAVRLHDFGVQSMPGGIMLGSMVSPHLLCYASPLDHEKHRGGTGTVQQNVDQYYTRWSNELTLPSYVHKLQLDFDWQVWVCPHIVPLSHPKSEKHRFYVMLADPLTRTAAGNSDTALHAATYEYWETAYEISCVGGDQAVNATELFHGLAGAGGINRHFGSRALKRKKSDGFNTPDDVGMYYWGDANNVPPPCQTVKEMLTKKTGPDGQGSCGAWARLMRLCLGLHGVGARTAEFTISLPIRTSLGFGAGAVQPYFCVKNHSFAIKNQNGTLRSFNVATGAWVNGAAVLNFDPDRKIAGVAQRFYFHRLGWNWLGGPQALDPLAAMHDANGVPGQGPVSNPVWSFRNHFLVRYGGKYYDPSYGNTTAWNDAKQYGLANLSGVILPDLLPPAGYFVAVKPYTAGAADKPPVYKLADTKL